MTEVDFQSITQPLTADNPCGPDLDLVGDEGYLSFLANAEGLLPSAFFSDGQPFDRGALDIDNQVAAIEKLLARTRDLRLVTLLARFLLLNDDLPGFGKTLDALATLLEAQWEAVHPRAEDGAFALRAAIVGTLDVPTVVFPLQFMPICDSRRLGPISFRTQMYATGDAKPREGDTVHPQAAIQQALREAAAVVSARLQSFVTIREALKRIHAAWIANSDFMSAPRLDQVTGVVDKIIAFLESALPQSASATGTAATPSPAAEVESRHPAAIRCGQDVRLALRAVAGYFQRIEPSSPVLPLVLQAEQLIGKSLFEILQILVPNHLAEAAYQIGGQHYFQLPIERLSGLMDLAPGSAETGGEPLDVLATADPPAEGEDPLTGAAPTEAAPEATLVHRHIAPFVVENRGHALTVLDQVSSFLRTAEPSNPIPWLIERARALADRDFLGVLKALLPPGAMREIEPGGDRN